MAKKSTPKPKSDSPRVRKSSRDGESAASAAPVSAQGKQLVIVESPTKAKTINKYLGRDYVVKASVGHVRDLPSRAPKGSNQPVPGVDLEHDFAPTYEVMPDKRKTIAELKKAAKEATSVWFATDLDREGEAIAWHLQEALNVPAERSHRVVFNAITKSEIQHAFERPRAIDISRVNAQQARRILDRIVGYQVSPLLWKKVAGGLSAGRVQSVAVRLVVEREREIEAFVPEEFWRITAVFAPDEKKLDALTQQWRKWRRDDVDEGDDRSRKAMVAWVSEHQCLLAELVDVRGQPFRPTHREEALKIAQSLGFVVDDAKPWDDPKAKGPAKSRVIYHGHVKAPASLKIASIETKRTRSKPSAPFITSTLQQAAANRMGFALQRTMRIAQQLYEGVDIKGSEGQTGLITYMRTDSTHLSPEAIAMARQYIGQEWGQRYLPDSPNVYTSSNKMAQEAHEAIRPTDVTLTPKRLKGHLSEEQFKLYQIIWERFLASQMVPAEWDSTTVLIRADAAQSTFKSTGRTLAFEGHYRASGIPNGGEEAILPPVKEGQPVFPVDYQPSQHFTSPPPRYTEASLQKKLEEEGIGRPSTYAAIIQTIQDRKYAQPVAPRDKRLYATDLGKVVTDKLVEAFPGIMEVAYTRDMEAELDKVEDDHHDWVTMLRQFYGPFKEHLDRAYEGMTHAKAEMEPAPHKCAKCGAGTVYRFGTNGRFLSCSRYPDCDFAAPIDREGNPLQAELSDILCPLCGHGMTKRTGRFGPFLGCENYPQCKGIVNLDPKKGIVVLPKTPPLVTDLPCPKCQSPLNMRDSKRGFWLSCSKYPKCRGRSAWSGVEPEKQKTLEAAWHTHIAEHPAPVIRNTEGKAIGDDYVPRIQSNDDNASAEPPAPAEPDAA
ncbi:MAG: type I DNA topoisomerase [Phycisphaeraceae bacterium]|nr:type I DNA topoisomerase [Phycisphaeraceae bacterium]